jgi:hypothetical protein
MDEATWLTSTHFQKLYGYLKKEQGPALTKEGRRQLRLFACACCRVLLWHLPVADCFRQAVEAAEAFAEGSLDGAGLEAAYRNCFNAEQSPFDSALFWARWSMVSTTNGSAAYAAWNVGPHAMSQLAAKDRPANRQRLCDLVRDIFGNPFRPLGRRAFPADVVGLARECYAAFPAVSDRFLILADALDDLGEEQAAEHCRQREHAKGCHVLDWILERK